MTGSVTRKFSALAATGCLLALTACDSETDATPGGPESPSASNSAAPSPSPSTPTPPTMPPDARGNSTASAKAFVRHYVDTLIYAGATGDTAGLARMNDKDCVACVAIVEAIDEVYESGGATKGRGWEVLSMTAAPGPSATEPIIERLSG